MSRLEAERRSLKSVPATCSDVDDAAKMLLREIDDCIDDAMDKVKERTGDLREALIEANEKIIEQEQEIERMKALLTSAAIQLAPKHGPDGNAYGFTDVDYPQGPSGFGESMEEAAINYLEERFGS